MSLKNVFESQGRAAKQEQDFMLVRKSFFFGTPECHMVTTMGWAINHTNGTNVETKKIMWAQTKDTQDFRQRMQLKMLAYFV